MFPMRSVQAQEMELENTVLVQEVPKIMVVDDDEELLQELQKMLSLGGYDVTVVHNSHTAFDEAQRIKPDMILMDLKMSPKSGFQVADEIKNAFYLKHIPIVAMTGFFTEKEHILMMKLCGIKSFILKPFNPVDLIARIEFALGRRKEEYDDGRP